MMTSDTITNDIRTLAREALDYHVAATREGSGERFDKFRYGSPDWTRDLALYAHEGGDILPDDWRYACMFSALEAIADADAGSDVSDVGHDFADGYVDVYTSALTDWLASSVRRVGYVDGACEEFGAPSDGGEDRCSALGQYAEAVEVFASVVAFLAERADGDEDDGDEPDLASWTRQAHADGVQAAEAAASWAADGNSDTDAIRETLRLMDDGDPMADDRLPAYPTLSGEWADDPTPLSLARDITGLDDPPDDVIDALADAWEAGVSETFSVACEAEMRKWVDENEHTHTTEIAGEFGHVTITDAHVSIRATRSRLYDWAHRPGAAWPCSELARCEDIRVQFDTGGLVELVTHPADIGEASDLTGDELSAWSSDVLRDVLPREHPAYEVCVGQFDEQD